MELSLGKLSAYKLFNCSEEDNGSIDLIVARFLEIGDAVATRWIETRRSVLILQMVPDNSASGAIYIFDRDHGRWFMLSFDACEDQFTSERFDQVFTEYDLFRLLEQPALLLTQFRPAAA